MLANPDNKNISIHKYDQEWFPTTMSAVWFLIIYSSILVYFKVIANMQWDICVRTKFFTLEGTGIKYFQKLCYNLC